MDVEKFMVFLIQGGADRLVDASPLAGVVMGLIIGTTLYREHPELLPLIYDVLLQVDSGKQGLEAAIALISQGFAEATQSA